MIDSRTIVVLNFPKINKNYIHNITHDSEKKAYFTNRPQYKMGECGSHRWMIEQVQVLIESSTDDTSSTMECDDVCKIELKLLFRSEIGWMQTLKLRMLNAEELATFFELGCEWMVVNQCA